MKPSSVFSRSIAVLSMSSLHSWVMSLSKTCGSEYGYARKNYNRLKSSESLFWTGVPMTAHRICEFNARTASEVNEEGSLIQCATMISQIQIR
jgi:hypothetical protein